MGYCDFAFETGGCAGWKFDGEGAFFVSFWIVGWDDVDEVLREVVP